jgi:sensor histidine kinase YesM
MPSQAEQIRLWPAILAVGGACWLVATSIEVIWLWPANMRVYNGSYVVSPQARLVARAATFLLAVGAYRLALAMGWPATLSARIRTAAVNIVLSALVLYFAIMAINTCGLYIDNRSDVLRDELGHLHVFDADWNTMLGMARFVVPVYFLGLAAVALVLLARRFRQNTLRMTQLSLDYANARIAMLSAQLQPHFLFNSLHAISELINVSPARATDLIARLGDFLRHALESSKQPWVSVRNEIDGLQAYLAVQRARFRDELEAEIDASPETLALTLPSMLLQPLVENAIEHGRRVGDGRLIVRLGLRRELDWLIIRVTNSRPTLAGPVPAGAYGNGLNNVSARLQAAYRGAASLQIGPETAGGTAAVLRLPALIAPPTDGSSDAHD